MNTIFKLLIVLVSLLMVLPTSTEHSQVIPTPIAIESLKWNSSGDRLLAAGRVGPGRFGWWIYNEHLQPLKVFEFTDSRNADWSPDGTRFSIGRDIFDTQTFVLQLTLEAASGIGGWTPDGTQVMAWADEARTRFGFYDSQTGEFVRSVAAGTDSVEMVNWSPNLAYFLTGDPTGAVWMVSAETGDTIYILPILYPLTTSWSPDGRYLAYTFTTHGVPADTPGAVLWGVEPWLASVVVWDVILQREVFRFDGIPSTPRPIRWHPNLLELTVATNISVMIWDIQTGQLLDTLLPAPGLSTITYTPFGGRLVMGSTNLSPDVYNLFSERQSSLLDMGYKTLSLATSDPLQVIVPLPSLERLNSIAESCLAPEIGVTSVSDETRLPEFVTAIEALSDDQIPPGCKADLLAVIETLQTRE
jgi:WD40 repeat protein